MIAAGCDSDSKKKPASDSSEMQVESYHADNDIAMTVASIADAIRVGEPLDTLYYNFEGILTDGQGHPLYTNIKGMPGAWDVEVLSHSSAVIKNMDVGDLLPEDLESYLADALNIGAENRIFHEIREDEQDTEISIYNFDGGCIRIETRKAVAPNGLEGPLMRIIVSKENTLPI